MSAFSIVPSRRRISITLSLSLVAFAAALCAGRPMVALGDVVYEPILITAPSQAVQGETVPVTVLLDAEASTSDPATVTITSSNGSIEGQYTVTSGDSPTFDVPVSPSASGSVTVSAYTDGAQTVSTTTIVSSNDVVKPR